MADRGQARSFDATAAAASGYQRPFLRADAFGEARKYTALGFFIQPAGGAVSFQAAGTSTAAAALRLTVGLATAAAGTATTAGALGLTTAAAAVVAGQASTTGDLGAGRAVTGQVAGVGVVAGSLDMIAVAGNVVGQASVIANLGLPGLRAASGGQAAVTAVTAAILAAGGVSGGAATTDGALSAQLALAAQAIGNATVAAGLSVALAPGYPEAVLADSPNLYWRFGEDSGVIAADSSIGSFNTAASYIGAVDHLAPSLITTAPGNNAVATTAAGQEITGTSNVGTVQPFSVEVWIKTTYSDAPQCIYYWRTSSSSNFNSAYLYLSTSGQLYGQLSMATPAYFFPSGPALNDGMPHHLVMTYGSGTMRVYVDGALFYTDTVTGRTGGGTMTHHVGLNPNNFDHQFYGTLDEYAVYKNVVLSAARVLAHYTAAGRAPWALAGTASAQATTLADLAALPGFLEASAAGQGTVTADLLVLLMVAAANGAAAVSLAELVRLASMEFGGNVALLKTLTHLWSGQVSKSGMPRMPMPSQDALVSVAAQRSNYI